MLRAILWHESGAKLVPLEPTTALLNGIAIAPSWSWASVGRNIAIVNELATKDGFRAFARIDDVEVGLVDHTDPFSAVTYGKITITGPFRRLKRLYNEQWRYPQVQMPGFKRCISEIVEKESPNGVYQKYSHSLGHYAVMQILQHFPSLEHVLELLFLEVTETSPDQGRPVYKRVGIVTLRSLSRDLMASPRLIQSLRNSENSLRSILQNSETVQRKVKWGKLQKDALQELRSEAWPLETIVIF
jgi:hypothetical protein